MDKWNKTWETVRPFTIWTNSWFHEKVDYEKLKFLFFTASELNNGCIVELGTFYGVSAITFALATKSKNIPIYSIDDYKNKIGGGGELYGPEDKLIFNKNVKTANVVINQISEDIIESAKNWTKPISILYWDIGDNTLSQSFHVWEKHVKSGGLFIIKDARNSLRNSKNYIESHANWRKHSFSSKGMTYSYKKINFTKLLL